MKTKLSKSKITLTEHSHKTLDIFLRSLLICGLQAKAVSVHISPGLFVCMCVLVLQCTDDQTNTLHWVSDDILEILAGAHNSKSLFEGRDLFLQEFRLELVQD